LLTRPAAAAPWLCSLTATSWFWMDKQLRNTPPGVTYYPRSPRQRSSPAIQAVRRVPHPTFSSRTANPSFHFILPGGPEIQAVVQGLTVAPNGDIVVVGGQTHFTQSGPIISNGLARLTPAGGLDSTFGNGGLFANVPPTDAGFGAVIVQPDGNIVTAGVGGGELVVSRFLGK